MINEYLENGNLISPMSVSEKMNVLTNQAKRAIIYKAKNCHERNGGKHTLVILKIYGALPNIEYGAVNYLPLMI
jgi:hypothetical protein